MLGFFGISIAEAVLLLGFAALVIDRILDAMGRSRSSRVLRVENSDLVRRNGELEVDQARHIAEIERLRRNISDLETALETVHALQQRRKT